MSGVDDLISKYNKFDPKVVRYLYNIVCGGNGPIAEETLATLTDQQATQILGSLSVEKGELTNHQKNLVSNFRTITGAKNPMAIKYLTNNAWVLEEAINRFFEGGEIVTPSIEGESVEDLFKKYLKSNEEEEDDRLSADAIIEFCSDLDVDPQKDISILIISWLLGAKSNYSISKDEWVNGFDKLGCDTLPEIKECLPGWKKKIKDKKQFRSFYKFVFLFSVVSKTMKPELACSLWKLLFKEYGKEYTVLDPWCEFVMTKYKKAVTKDTWNQFFDFVTTMKPDLSNFDPEFDCYPSIMDEFSDFYKKFYELKDNKAVKKEGVEEEKKEEKKEE